MLALLCCTAPPTHPAFRNITHLAPRSTVDCTALHAYRLAGDAKNVQRLISLEVSSMAMTLAALPLGLVPLLCNKRPVLIHLSDVCVCVCVCLFVCLFVRRCRTLPICSVCGGPLPPRGPRAADARKRRSRRGCGTTKRRRGSAGWGLWWFLGGGVDVAVAVWWLAITSLTLCF